MRNKEIIDDRFYSLFNISNKSKIYNSNIGFIIVSEKGDYVYKIFNNKEFYDKELLVYNILKNKGSVLLPNFLDMGNVFGSYIIRLENIRKHFKRKNNILDLDLKQIAQILFEIHSIKNNGKSLILGDIHSSNFFETLISNEKKIGIFDFSSSKYGDIEEDIGNIFIDIGVDINNLNVFLSNYNFIIDFNKMYKYTIIELHERIKNGMNLSLEKKKMYYKFLLKIKQTYGN